MMRHGTRFVMIAIVLSSGLLSAQSSQPVTTHTSAGKAIQDAAKAAAQERVAEDSDRPADADRPERAAEETAKESVPIHTKFGWATILTNTGRVNVAPYVGELCSKVRLKWFAALKATEHAQYAHAILAIEFVVHADGSVSEMKLVESSDDETLNQATWTGVTGAAPFAPLPTGLKDGYLKLRLQFFYNPTRDELRESRRSGLRRPPL